MTGLWNHLILYLQFQSFVFFQYVRTIKVFIYKRVCDHVTYSTSIGNSFQPCAHMYMITCGQPEGFCLSEKYFRSLGAPLVQNSTWCGKINASLYLSSLWKACVFFVDDFKIGFIFGSKEKKTQMIIQTVSLVQLTQLRLHLLH